MKLFGTGGIDLVLSSQARSRAQGGGMQSSNWKWHLDEVFVKINGERHYLWRVVDHEGEVLKARH